MYIFYTELVLILDPLYHSSTTDQKSLNNFYNLKCNIKYV